VITSRSPLVETRSERGSVLPLILVICSVCVVCGLGLVRVGDAAAKRARADAVADVAALAGVAGGQRGAEEVIASARAGLVSFRQDSAEVVHVTVMVAGVTASATAAAIGEEIPSAGSTLGRMRP